MTQRYTEHLIVFSAILSVLILCLCGETSLRNTQPAIAATRATQSLSAHPIIAILDFGGDASAARTTDELSGALAFGDEKRHFVNRDLARTAARGAGYQGSLNLTLEEARDIGRSIGCDLFFAGRAETLRRSASKDRTYYEAYAAVFLISTRTGRLVMFDFADAEAANAAEAQDKLRRTVKERATRYRTIIFRTFEDEKLATLRAAESAGTDDTAPLVEDATTDDETLTDGLRLPQPYRRVSPIYTEQAARAGVEATVDVAVEIGADGEPGTIEVRRWAGFGLDETVAAAVRAMHFRPAVRHATKEAVPLRVLLRYNFKRPVAHAATVNSSHK